MWFYPSLSYVLAKLCFCPLSDLQPNGAKVSWGSRVESWVAESHVRAGSWPRASGWSVSHICGGRQGEGRAGKHYLEQLFGHIPVRATSSLNAFVWIRKNVLPHLM